MPKIQYQYRQRAIVRYSGTLEVPEDVLAQGKDAVHEYIRENEPAAEDTEHKVDECLEEVLDSMGFHVVEADEEDEE